MLLIDLGQVGEEPQHRLVRRADLPPDADVLEELPPQAPAAPSPQRADSRALPVDRRENLRRLGQCDELLVRADSLFACASLS